MKKLIIALLTSLSVLPTVAQTFDVDIQKPQRFSVCVPDGNYKVTLTVGSKKRAAETVVRAENRRLLLESVKTPRRTQQTVSFAVNKRTPYINSKLSVKIKDREKGYLTWNDSLDLEFAGTPAVTRIVIEPDTTMQTVFLCGNSTVTDQAYEPWCSWGQMFPRWFDDRVAVMNCAESGLTARTFIAGNRLEQICERLRKGDVVICEFGHNDEKEHRPGDGAWYHYVYNLKIFVDRVREKGGEVIFCTPTQRRFYEKDNKTIKNTHGDFPAAMLSVAEREHVPVVDLTTMTTAFYQALGFEGSKRALVHYPANTYPNQEKPLADNTHFNPYGAYEISKMVVSGLLKIKSEAPAVATLLSHLRSDWTSFDSHTPDNPDTFRWYDAPSYEIVKPDGN